VQRARGVSKALVNPGFRSWSYREGPSGTLPVTVSSLEFRVGGYNSRPKTRDTRQTKLELTRRK
jgi:hypothetical protein